MTSSEVGSELLLIELFVPILTDVYLFDCFQIAAINGKDSAHKKVSYSHCKYTGR